jgi:hypothetical protein
MLNVQHYQCIQNIFDQAEMSYKYQMVYINANSIWEQENVDNLIEDDKDLWDNLLVQIFFPNRENCMLNVQHYRSLISSIK